MISFKELKIYGTVGKIVFFWGIKKNIVIKSATKFFKYYNVFQYLSEFQKKLPVKLSKIGTVHETYKTNKNIFFKLQADATFTY